MLDDSRHQAIIRTNMDLSVRSSDIHLSASSQEVLQSSVTKINLKITFLKAHENLLGANELISIVFGLRTMSSI